MEKGWIDTSKGDFKEFVTEIMRRGEERTAAIFVRYLDNTPTMLWQPENIDAQMQSVPLSAAAFDELAAKLSKYHDKGQAIIRCWPFVFTRQAAGQEFAAMRGIAAIEQQCKKLLAFMETNGTFTCADREMLMGIAKAVASPPPTEQEPLEARARRALIDAGVQAEKPFSSGAIPCVCGEAKCLIVWHKSGRGPIVAGSTGPCGYTMAEMDGWHDPEAKRV